MNVPVDALSILEGAIANTADWRVWSPTTKDLIQIEFGGVQLWTPPLGGLGAPSSLIALDFENPKALGFLVRKNPPEDLPANWADLLARDELTDTLLPLDTVTMTSMEKVDAMFEEADTVEWRLGDRQTLSPSDPFLALWAGPVGIVVTAGQVKIRDLGGEIDWEDLEGLSKRWWSYWRDYWDHRATNAPLPRDPLCEMVVPTNVDLDESLLEKASPKLAAQIRELHDKITGPDGTPEDLIRLGERLHEAGDVETSEILLRRNILEEGDEVHQTYVALHGHEAERLFEQSRADLEAQLGVELTPMGQADFLDMELEGEKIADAPGALPELHDRIDTHFTARLLYEGRKAVSAEIFGAPEDEHRPPKDLILFWRDGTWRLGS